MGANGSQSCVARGSRTCTSRPRPRPAHCVAFRAILAVGAFRSQIRSQHPTPPTSNPFRGITIAGRQPSEPFHRISSHPIKTNAGMPVAAGDEHSRTVRFDPEPVVIVCEYPRSRWIAHAQPARGGSSSPAPSFDRCPCHFLGNERPWRLPLGVHSRPI
jgi:hypothetical protein